MNTDHYYSHTDHYYSHTDQWSKTLKVGDRISYADVCFWQTRGKLIKLEGNKARVTWDKYGAKEFDEYTPNLISWHPEKNQSGSILPEICWLFATLLLAALFIVPTVRQYDRQLTTLIEKGVTPTASAK